MLVVLAAVMVLHVLDLILLIISTAVNVSISLSWKFMSITPVVVPIQLLSMVALIS